MTDTASSPPGQRGGPDTASVRTVASVVLATTAGVVPVFLLGGLAVQVADDIGLRAGELGGLVTVFFGISAVSSTPAGRLAERLGAYRSIVVAAVCSATALIGIGAIGRDLLVISLFLVLAGVSNSLSQPAANLLLARGIPQGHQGLAFGIKQAAAPLASLAAGAAVPTFGLTVGWQWAFVVAVATPILTVVLAPRIDAAPVRRGATARPRSSMRALVALAIAAGAGTAAATTLGTFLVSGAVDAGMGTSAAGALLAVGSAVGVATRIVAGWRADRGRTGHLRAARTMMVAGAVGFGLLAFAPGVPMLVLGGLIGFGAGWGWNGLLVYAVVRANADAPAAATGITQTGLYLGGMTGPLAFGLVSERWGFDLGWTLGAILLLVAAAAATAGERWLGTVET